MVCKNKPKILKFVNPQKIVYLENLYIRIRYSTWTYIYPFLLCFLHIIALGLVFQPLGNTGVMWKAIDLRFNLYTGPGFLIALLCIFNGVLLVVLFREFNVHGTKKKIPLKQLFYLCVKKEENCGSKLHRLGQDGELNHRYIVCNLHRIVVLQKKF